MPAKRKTTTETSTANLSFEHKLWLTSVVQEIKMMNMNYLSLFAAIAFCTACGTHSGAASDDHPKQKIDDTQKVTVRPSELPEGITLSDASLKVDVLQILVQRGGKDPKDRWIVDLFEGDIRIRKSRTDNTVYPPGASVEFWRKESNGGWKRLPTA